MHLTCFFGPTGVGKTATATALARKTGSPVIVLDRLQAYPELGVGTARPPVQDYVGTERLYLPDRAVTDGDYEPDLAYEDFRGMLGRLRPNHEHVIVEGGSISLIQRLTAFPPNDVTLLVSYRTPAPGLDYASQLWSRVFTEMLVPDGRMTLLRELQQVWRDYPTARPFLRSIVGYDEIIRYCETEGLHISSLSVTNPHTRSVLADCITTAHLNYAHQQLQTFRALPAPFRLCEPVASFPLTVVQGMPLSL